LIHVSSLFVVTVRWRCWMAYLEAWNFCNYHGFLCKWVTSHHRSWAFIWHT